MHRGSCIRETTKNFKIFRIYSCTINKQFKDISSFTLLIGRGKKCFEYGVCG